MPRGFRQSTSSRVPILKHTRIGKVLQKVKVIFFTRHVLNDIFQLMILLLHLNQQIVFLQFTQIFLQVLIMTTLLFNIDMTIVELVLNIQVQVKVVFIIVIVTLIMVLSMVHQIATTYLIKVKYFILHQTQPMQLHLKYILVSMVEQHILVVHLIHQVMIILLLE